MQEIIFVLLLAGGMIGSGVYMGIVSGYWHFLYVILTFFACFGFWEWHAIATTGFSVSQQVWEFSKIAPTPGFWAFIGGNIIAWLSLMYHFARKKIKKGKNLK